MQGCEHQPSLSAVDGVWPTSRVRMDKLVEFHKQSLDGRHTHRKAEKDQSKSVNTKERKLAFQSAVAATADPSQVEERGHQFENDVELPLVVSDEFEELIKTQEVVDVLESLGVHADIVRSDENKSIRAGRGKTRGRKYRRPKSILFITSDEPSKAARNLAGADVVTAANVSAEDLAPGTQPGRLTVYTESAIKEVADR